MIYRLFLKLSYPFRLLINQYKYRKRLREIRKRDPFIY